MTKHRSRRFSPQIVIAAAALIAAAELFNSTILRRWLGDSIIVRVHLPTMLVAAAVLIAGLISFYEYHGIGPQNGIIRRGPNRPAVAITFDDGPSPVFTPVILDILKEKGVKATFFMCGHAVEKYPDVAARVYREGHEIGNHTYTHKNLVPASRQEILTEVDRTEDALRRLIGVRTKLFRPPRGIYSNKVRKLLVDEFDYTIALWNVSTADWSGRRPQSIIKRVRHYARPGAIILFHDSGAIVKNEGADRGNTVEALPAVVDALREKGLDILSLSALLGSGKDDAPSMFMEDVPLTTQVDKVKAFRMKDEGRS